MSHLLSGLDDISVQINGSVCTVRFDRPEVLNAFRSRTRAELQATLTTVATEPSIRVVVFTGSGRAFSAGQDLRELSHQFDRENSVRTPTDGELERHIEGLQDLTRAVLALPQVTIAALNGVAVGLGAELALACDLRVAAHSATIGFPEAKRAMFQTNGVMWLLPRIVGLARATELVLTGRLLTAIRAEQISLVHAACPDNDLSETVAALALEVVASAPLSLRLAKDLLHKSWQLDLETVMQMETAGMRACLRSQDLREGVDAFMQGREPKYEGR